MNNNNSLKHGNSNTELRELDENKNTVRNDECQY